MNNSIPTDDWLRTRNEELRTKDVHPRQRPWLVVIEWLKLTGRTTQFREPDIRRIFDWFAENTKPGSQAIGSLFTGAMYFDGCMWPIDMPIIIGRARLDARDSLKAIPKAISEALLNNQAECARYTSFWCDCGGYCYGFPTLIAALQQNSFALELLLSADKQLRASASLLLVPNPDQKSLEGSRLAMEMFLKVFLAARDSLDENSAKNKYGHDLIKSIERCAEILPCAEFQNSIDVMNHFPPISDRYKVVPTNLRDLATAFSVTLHIAAHIVCTLTGHLLTPANAKF